MNTNTDSLARPRPTPRWCIALVVFLLVLLVAQTTLSMSRKSVTVDEIMYIAAGYYHLQTGDFSMNMTNPPLMKVLAALPLLALRAELPEVETDPAGWSLVEQWRYARRFLYDNRVDADRLLFVARLPVVALAVLLGLFVYRWAGELGGRASGCLALFLYSMSPNILAHARLATHDLGLTAFMFISAFYFWRYMKKPAMKPLVLCGVFSGLSLLTKTTAAFLAPIFGIYVLVCLLRRNGLGIHERFPLVNRLSKARTVERQLLSAVLAFSVIGLIVLVTLNIGYGFQGTFTSPDANGSSGVLAGLPLPVPQPFARLIGFQADLTERSGQVYFAGRLYQSGLWYLMVVSLLIKTPIALLVMTAAASVLLLRRVRTLESEWLLAAFAATILFVFSYLGNINMGLRYVLPIYPVIHVLTSTLLRPPMRRPKTIGMTVGALCILYLFSSLSIHPHYLAYFNTFVGGPKNGHRYLTDSNLDWGQDLKSLKEYMDGRGIERIALGYFGSADASYYGIDYDYLPSVGLAPQKPGQFWWYEEEAVCTEPTALPKGTVAISATLLASQGWMTDIFGECYAHLRDVEPVDQVGHSILIYEIE